MKYSAIYHLGVHIWPRFTILLLCWSNFLAQDVKLRMDATAHLDVWSKPRNVQMLDTMLSYSTSTHIENNGRRLIAVVYLQDGKFANSVWRLFVNFISSCRSNAPLFAAKKLLVVAFDTLSFKFVKSFGHEHVLLASNLSAQTHSVDKFILVDSLLAMNITVLLMEADQIVLANPFQGLVGDADLEISSDFGKPSLIFRDAKLSSRAKIEDLADNTNIGTRAVCHVSTHLMSATGSF